MRSSLYGAQTKDFTKNRFERIGCINFKFELDQWFAFLSSCIMAGILRYLKTIDFKKIPKWIGENPIKSTYIGLLLESPIIDRYLKERQLKH